MVNASLEEAAATVEDAILTRRSTRAFETRPVARDVIERVLALGGRAPSGSNLQPWRAYVVTGSALKRLSAALQGAYLRDEPQRREYNYYTDPLYEPYLARRRACGWGLYGTLGIERGEKDRMKAQRAKNYAFFGAPVGMVFTIDRKLEIGSWMDYGMFLQNLMLAARGFGLHTCPQASIAEYPDIVRAQLGIGEENTVVCGMALGYRRADDIVNAFQPERLGVTEFATFLES